MVNPASRARIVLGHWRLWRSRNPHPAGNSLLLDTRFLFVCWKAEPGLLVVAVGPAGVMLETNATPSLHLGWGIKRLRLVVDPPMDQVPSVNIQVTWRDDIVRLADEVREFDAPS